ncbi:helix-turn-helix domain-containing protein [Longimicrobium sp.]|uniref:winged helix-turn-helix transcriptional regulator n=1 Tax=Longimicrobium sp. TaxID=2029185 RepID=UPI002E2EC2CE|nr:helix-turn-helix domain-containing protein [Longimicrobium sp.]HEX6037265.1 helix-turn-helix domain-containing protein [Longimicrobium sp.]
MNERRRNGSAPVESALDVVRKRWKASVLLELAGGGLRYGELHARLSSVPYKVLTEVLRELESDGLLARFVKPGHRKHVEYGITPSGAQLVPILRALGEWRENSVS